MQELLSCSFILLSICVSGSAICADTAKEAAAQRFEKPLTIQCTGSRLHSVLQHLSAATGVSVRCGANERDWMVRDIPVVVCAKDVPLDKLLRAIADSAHLLLSKNEIAGKMMGYRIWRDATRRKELDAYYAAVDAATQSEARRDWDVLSLLKDAPDSGFKDAERYSVIRTQVRALAGIISALGPEARERVLSGEEIRIGPNSGPEPAREKVKTLLQEFSISFDTVRNRGKHPPMLMNCSSCHARAEDSRGMTIEELATGMREKSAIGIRYDPDTKPGTGPLRMTFYQAYAQNSDLTLWMMQDSLREDHLKLPPRVNKPKPPRFQPGSEYALIDPLDSEGSGSPILHRKVILEAPKDKKDITYDDALSALSNATGISVICEGFPRLMIRVQVTGVREPKDLFGKELTIREILLFAPNIVWWYDAQDRIMMGVDREWPERYRNLIPEQLFQSLVAKLNGPGLWLDDLEPLLGITAPQSREWLQNSDDARLFPRLVILARDLSEPSLWQLYYGLKATDQEKAKSSAGLSLANFDHTRLAEVLAHAVRQRRSLLNSADSVASLDAQESDVFLDPEVLPTLVMRIVSDKAAEDEWRYSLVIEGEYDGQRIETREYLGILPIYSLTREAELKKKLDRRQSLIQAG